MTAGHRSPERLDAGHRERLEPGDGVGQPPLLEQGRVRVDARAERAERVHRGAQPVAVGRGWSLSRAVLLVGDADGVGEAVEAVPSDLGLELVERPGAARWGR